MTSGFSIGGIPPFGHTRPIRTVMDPDLGRFGTVWAAAGTPNTVFAVTPGTLRMLANANVAPIASAPLRPNEERAADATDAGGPAGTTDASGAPGAAGAPSGA